jgi:hypothetical protein
MGMRFLKWIWTRVTNALAEVLEEEYRQSFRGQFEKNRVELDKALSALRDAQIQQAADIIREDRSRRSPYNKPSCLN